MRRFWIENRLYAGFVLTRCLRSLSGDTSMSKKKRIDPIPQEFTSYEQAAEFWDKHDTTHYPDTFRTV